MVDRTSVFFGSPSSEEKSWRRYRDKLEGSSDVKLSGDRGISSSHTTVPGARLPGSSLRRSKNSIRSAILPFFPAFFSSTSLLLGTASRCIRPVWDRDRRLTALSRTDTVISLLRIELVRDTRYVLEIRNSPVHTSASLKGEKKVSRNQRTVAYLQPNFRSR